MIARLLGIVIVLVPVALIMWLFFWILRRKNRRDLIAEEGWKKKIK